MTQKSYEHLSDKELEEIIRGKVDGLNWSDNNEASRTYQRVIKGEIG
ncbi:MAG: hypothetical protein JWR10_890 [Rubritepida sp.]|nr:hypothetical protein [Rubritepida sp.]